MSINLPSLSACVVCVCLCVRVCACACVCVLTHLGSSWKEVGMVATLLEVHHDIEQGDGLGTSLVQLLKVPGQNPAIEFPDR